MYLASLLLFIDNKEQGKGGNKIVISISRRTNLLSIVRRVYEEGGDEGSLDDLILVTIWI